MKKIILVMCILSLTTTANAACNGGTERSGFCVSNITMNWWSAATWCQANGRSLATMYDICPDWNGNQGVVCPAFGGGGWVWTATANGNVFAFFLNLDDGNVSGGQYSGGSTRGGAAHALCR